MIFVGNPGSFAKNRTFLFINPVEGIIEESEVPIWYYSMYD